MKSKEPVESPEDKKGDVIILHSNTMETLIFIIKFNILYLSFHQHIYYSVLLRDH